MKHVVAVAIVIVVVFVVVVLIKPGFHMIVTVVDASATCPRSVGDIWKRSLL